MRGGALKSFFGFALVRLTLGAALVFGGISGADADVPFYEGKVLRLIVGSGPGSAYDLYGRILAAYLSPHIPGHPTVVVQTMVGAAGLVSAGYMYNAAPRDGTTIALAVSTLPTAPLLHADIAKFDVNKFAWLGNMAKDVYIAFVWSSVPVKSFEDLKTREVIMGAINQATSSDLAVLSNTFVGTKMKIVSGYDDQTGIKLAIERGELEGTFGSAYSGLKLERPDWLADNKIRVILQHGFERLPEFPDVPLFIDQVKTPEDRQALELELAPQEFNKPLYAPPGVPADRVNILRRAFDDTLKDPDFLAAAAKAKIWVTGAMTGEELAEKVAHVAATPREVADRVNGILANYNLTGK